MLTLAIYYVLVLFTLFIVRNTRLAVILSLILSFTVSALRFNAGFDYFSYMTIIDDGNFGRFEPLNRVLMEVSARTSVYFYYFSTAVVTFFFFGLALIRGVDKYRISRLSVLAFVAFPVGFIESFGMIRQFGAAAILLYAFMRRDNWRIWIPLCALAPLFHFSSIVWVPAVIAFPWLGVRLPRIAYIAILATSPLLGEFVQTVAQTLNFYGHYFQNNINDFGAKIGILFALLAIFIIFKLPRVSDFQRHFNVFFFAVCLYLALSPYGNNIARGAWYGILLYPILIGAILRNHFFEKAVAVAGLTVLFFSHFYLDNLNPNWQPISNYEFSFLVSEEERLNWIERWRVRFYE